MSLAPKLEMNIMNEQQIGIIKNRKTMYNNCKGKRGGLPPQMVQNFTNMYAVEQ